MGGPVTWLINSMQLEINKPFLFLSTAKKSLECGKHIPRKECCTYIWIEDNNS